MQLLALRVQCFFSTLCFSYLCCRLWAFFAPPEAGLGPRRSSAKLMARVPRGSRADRLLVTIKKAATIMLQAASTIRAKPISKSNGHTAIKRTPSHPNTIGARSLWRCRRTLSSFGVALEQWTRDGLRTWLGTTARRARHATRGPRTRNHETKKRASSSLNNHGGKRCT